MVSTANIVPDGEIVTEWTTKSGATHWESVAANDADYVQATADDDSEVEEFTCSTFTLGTNECVTGIQIKCQAKDSGDRNNAFYLGSD